jgi:membrane-associated protein
MIEFLVRYGPSLGYLMIFGIIFAESGLLIGFFLPGDSLLFTAGFLASPASQALLQRMGLPAESSFFSLPILCIGCFLAAVIGDSVGYTFGRRVGPRLFQREDSLLFSKKNVLKAQEFYEKHGGKAIVLARFVPVVRTFAPIVAGIGEMNYRRFLSFNLMGGLIWAVGVTILGYFLADVIGPDNIDKYLLPIIALIILISVAPAAYHLLKDKENRDAMIANFNRLVRRSPASVTTSESTNEPLP